MLDIGRVCVKTAGREAGKYCVIVKKMEESFVLITGPKSVTGVKRRRCNTNHLEPTMDKVKIKEDASDSEVEKALKEIGFEEKEVRVSAKPRIEALRAEVKPEPKEEIEERPEPKKSVEKKAKEKRPGEKRAKPKAKKPKAKPKAEKPEKAKPEKKGIVKRILKKPGKKPEEKKPKVVKKVKKEKLKKKPGKKAKPKAKPKAKVKKKKSK
jgi:large subunit ribosomal protein L14e